MIMQVTSAHIGTLNSIISLSFMYRFLDIPWLLKINPATFEVNMTNHSQDITKKQFQQ